MTLLDTVRPTRGGAVGTAPDEAAARALPLMTRGQFGVLLLIGAVLLAGTLALVFGPGRGLREDIGDVQDDLASSQKGIYGTLGTGRESLAVVRQQLAGAERSLVLQRQGLEVAQAAEQDTTAIRAQTDAALQTVREVSRALGGVDAVGKDVATLVRSAEQGVRLARAALAVAEQTLATGQQALAVARETLSTLQQSKAVQDQLLEVARQTLEEARRIDRKIPGAPVFPAAP